MFCFWPPTIKQSPETFIRSSPKTWRRDDTTHFRRGLRRPAPSEAVRHNFRPRHYVGRACGVRGRTFFAAHGTRFLTLRGALHSPYAVRYTLDKISLIKVFSRTYFKKGRGAMHFEFYREELAGVPKLSVDGTVGNALHLSYWRSFAPRSRVRRCLEHKPGADTCSTGER
jgi:hypothetical protein